MSFFLVTAFFLALMISSSMFSYCTVFFFDSSS